MAELENRVNKLEETISALLQHIKDVNHSITSGFEKVDKNFDKVNDKIDALRGRSTSSIETVELKLDDLTSEIKKINEVSGYDDLYANNKGLRIVNKK